MPVHIQGWPDRIGPESVALSLWRNERGNHAAPPLALARPVLPRDESLMLATRSIRLRREWRAYSRPGFAPRPTAGRAPMLARTARASSQINQAIADLFSRMRRVLGECNRARRDCWSARLLPCATVRR